MILIITLPLQVGIRIDFLVVVVLSSLHVIRGDKRNRWASARASNHKIRSSTPDEFQLNLGQTVKPMFDMCYRALIDELQTVK